MFPLDCRNQNHTVYSQICFFKWCSCICRNCDCWDIIYRLIHSHICICDNTAVDHDSKDAIENPGIMERKLKQWWQLIPPTDVGHSEQSPLILTEQPDHEHTTTYDTGNSDLVRFISNSELKSCIEKYFKTSRGHLRSVKKYKLHGIQKLSQFCVPLKPLGQMNRNLVGSIYGRSPMQIAYFSPVC